MPVPDPTPVEPGHCCHYHYARAVYGMAKTGPCGGPPMMSTDFPGQPFGRGDTVTVITEPADEGLTESNHHGAPDASDADVYLDAARAQIRNQWPAHEAFTDYDENEAQDLAQRVAFRAAVDAARAPLLAENADLNQHINELRAKLIDQAKRYRVELDRLEAEQARTDRRLLEAEAERDLARASLAGAVAANDALAAELAEAGFAEGGEWSVRRGWMNGDRFQTYTSSAEGFMPPCGPTHQQRTWTGPVEPVTETEARGG